MTENVLHLITLGFDPVAITNPLWRIIVGFFAHTWWLILFLLAVPITRSTWIYWRQRTFEHSLEWVYLELKIPREIIKSARSMDQAIQAIHTLRNAAVDLGEIYLLGEVTVWYTFEMVSFGGDIHFYMRVFKPQKRMVEAALFAYYPDVEIVEVEDYTKQLPQNMTDMDLQGLESWGTEMVLNREPVFGVKMYADFESSDESEQFDPISVMMEVLGKVRPGEFVGLQYNFAPDELSWGSKYQKVIDKLKEPKIKEFTTGADKSRQTIQRTDRDREVLKSVEKNVEKPGYKTIIRMLYISPKDIYHENFARRVVRGVFNQYATSDLNHFVDQERITTRVTAWMIPFIFRKSRLRMRRARLLYDYIHREVEVHTFMGKLLTSHPFHFNFHAREIMLNSATIATLFHPPTILTLTAPHVQRMESSKMAAPAGLPIYAEDEGVLDQFNDNEE